MKKDEPVMKKTLLLLLLLLAMALAACGAPILQDHLGMQQSQR